MIQHIHTFQNCSCTIEDIQNPETGKVEGRAFIILDNDSGEVWRYPMPENVAKQQGQRLMGIGNISVANGSGMKEEIKQHRGGKG